MITNFETGSNQFLEAETKIINGLWSLVVNKRVDYELLNNNGMFAFSISNLHSVILQIKNIDDNPPSIVPITVPCEVEVTMQLQIFYFLLLN